MAAKKKTPTLAQVRKLAKEKLGDNCECTVKRSNVWPRRWIGLASNVTANRQIPPSIDVWTPSRSAAFRALFAALEAL